MAEEGRSRTWDITMMVLLVGSVILVFVYEALSPTGNADIRRVLAWVDLVLVVFFVLEWLWRVRAADRSGRYALRTSWELLGMVPIFLPLPPALRALRLVRLVRILRVFRILGTYLGFWERIAQQGHLGKIAAAGGAVTVLGAFLVWLLERETNPALDRFPEALWWAVVTVTTVGYGDITPRTPSGQVVAAGLMIIGIGVIGLLASTLASALITQRKEADEAEETAAAEDGQMPYAPVPARAGSLAAELNALSALHAQGRLTDDEFRRAKQQTLESVE